MPVRIDPAGLAEQARAWGLELGFQRVGIAAIDPWLEGLQLNQLKIYDKGKPVQCLLDMICDNIRYPESSMGDLRAQITACQLGVRRLDLVEDVVQAALAQALQTWSRRGVPDDPAAWLFRTARNLAVDALRRERVHLDLHNLALDGLRLLPHGHRPRPHPCPAIGKRAACHSSLVRADQRSPQSVAQ